MIKNMATTDSDYLVDSLGLTFLSELPCHWQVHTQLLLDSDVDRSVARVNCTFDRVPDTHCAICLKRMHFANRLTACGHSFHCHCLHKWFQQDNTRYSCPLCRTPSALTLPFLKNER